MNPLPADNANSETDFPSPSLCKRGVGGDLFPITGKVHASNPSSLPFAKGARHFRKSPKYWLPVLLCLKLPGCAITGNTLVTKNPLPLGESKASPPPIEAALVSTTPQAEGSNPSPSTVADSTAVDSNEQFRAFGRRRAAELLDSTTPPPPPVANAQQPFLDYGREQGEDAEGEFFKGRYNRSRARLPENIEKWRTEPDIDNPGPDLANFPNSAFTLPQGRAYIEMSPVAFYGSALGSPAQYNAEFLLRYGLTDDIELRLFSNGPSWAGGSEPTWGFSPIAFDTKIQLWTEKPAYFLPAAGFEAYLQTEWLGNKAFNGGTQPSFTFNFDQSLPWGVDFEYNLGATRFQDNAGDNIWKFGFQWAFQRDLFNKDFAAFIHGYYNAASLPRLPNVQLPYFAYKTPTQNAVGGGFIWTASKRLALYGQVSGGTTKFTPSVIGLFGFAVSF